MFHDSTPVLARDCAASVARWMARDPLGQSLKPRLDAIEAPDDGRLVFQMNAPFPRMLTLLGKLTAVGIMPERLARTEAFTQVTDIMGSGPFRFSHDEHVSGSRAVFTRFDGYLPRDEPVDYCAGGRRALVDRVEWHVIPDAATAAGALLAGEVDWVDMPLPDLLPLLRRSRDVVVSRLDPIRLFPQCRPNMLQGPTANLGVRRAILAAIDQREVMQAVMGEDARAWRSDVGVFVPDRPGGSRVGFDRLGPKPVGEVRAMLDAAKYHGGKVVLLHPTDQPFYGAMCNVVAARLTQVGINVSDEFMDRARWCSAGPARRRWTRAAGRCSARPRRRWTTSTR